MRARAARTSILVAALTLTSLPSNRAEADPGPWSTVTVNPIDLVNGFFNFEVESAMGPAATFHVGLNALVWDGVWTDYRNDRYFAIGPEMGLRLFPFLGAPGGLWVGPYVGVAYVDIERGNTRSTSAGFYAGGMIGVTFISFDVLVISLGAGLGYADLSDRIEGDEVGLRGISPRFRLALGFAF